MTQSGYCPVTGTKGKKIDTATMKSLLSISLRHVRDVQYFFCAESDCDVVYFSEDGEQVFHTHEIRERVYQKEPDQPDVPICYCFRHTLGDLQQEIKTASVPTIEENIVSGIQAGQCACDWRNPQGDCCLGNVRHVMKQLRNVTQS